MGAPTSPVLSNLATIGFDRALGELARLRGWVYTRFADDLTFSADEPFTAHDVQEIRALAAAHALVFNEEKFAVRSPGTRKTVTGLDLTETRVVLPPAFVDETLAEIGKLKYLLEIHYRSGRPTTDWLDQYQQQIEGQLAFADFVLDPDDAQLSVLRTAYQNALLSPDTCEPVSWINTAYLQQF
ncbi:hypothetical protein ACO2Q8_28830 [Larkinella sp. VNQ87]|uniref:hypothetical protein n=1 Tax=Larkinella sp. VNQ87 TaxID=3400921 RepID=UPI003C01F216